MGSMDSVFGMIGLIEEIDCIYLKCFSEMIAIVLTVLVHLR